MGLVSRQRLEADVDYYALWLEDASETENGSPPEEEDALVCAHEGRVYLRSGGHTHTAEFVAEVWDCVPPESDDVWEARGEAEMPVPSGEVVLWTFGGASEGTVDLGRRDGRWGVRVHVTGQREVHELAQQGETPHGVERYLAQFWPV